ncbi:MAG: InlB B-repeat-containing protein [Treponema sp.]|nr:InlB B-repeat-containing protein [Treponema sp.]
MKKIRTIFKKLLAAALIAGAGMAAWAETKTIDLSKGRLTIRSDGYTQGGSTGHSESDKVSAVQYTGDYVLTGSCTANPALQIRNWSGEKMTVNITLDNASIIGDKWCSAFTVGGNADVDLYLTIKGNCRVSAYNHGAIQLFANTTLYVNITDTEGSSFSLESRYEPQNHPNYEVPSNYPGGVIIFERNGVVQDNKGNTLTKSYVIFNTNGGSSVKTQQIEKGAKATKPDDPTKNYLDFLGWYADEDLTTEFNFDTAITENVTQVYAKWAEAVASVSNGTTTSYYGVFSDALAAWTEETTLKLLKDVEISSTITVPSGSTRTLDLNGYGINGNKKVITVIVVNGNLTLKDSNPGSTHKFTVSNVASNGAGLATVNDALTGTEGTDYKTFTGGYITGGTSKGENCGGGIRVVSGATLNMEGGTIIGNGTVINYDTGMRGSGVMVQGTFNMSGGNIIYNYVYNEGGGVDVLSSSANMTMSGGKISYNYANMEAGGVHGWDKPTFTMSGGEITSNYSKGNSGGVDTGGNYGTTKLSGSPVIKDNIAGTKVQNLYIKSGCIQIIGELTDEADVYVTLPSPGVFTNSANKTYNDASKFFSDDANYTVLKNSDGQLKVSVPPVATVTTTAGVTTEYATFASALSAWVDESTLTLLRNCTTTTTIELKEGTHTLDLNGLGIKYTGAAPSNSQTKAAVLWVESNLTITDSNPTNTDTDENRPTDPSTNKKVVGGFITGGKGCLVGSGNSQSKGGGIYISTSGTVTMNAGTIIDCHVVNNGNTNHGGGAVYIGNGLFTMNGGAILGCSVETSAGTGWGGAVCVDGNFELKGGRIEHNYITGNAAYGAGVWARDNNVVTGASIVKNNKANGKPNNFQVNGDSSNTTNLPKIYGLTEGADVYVYTTKTPTQSADVMFAKNSDRNSIKYIHSDNAASASIVYDDGTNNWVYYNGKILKLRKNAFAHTHNEKSLWLSVFVSEANIDQNVLNGTWSKFTYTGEKPNVLTAHLMSDSGEELEQTDLTLTGGQKELTADIAPFTEETEVVPVVKACKYNKTLDAIPTEVGVYAQNVVLTVGGKDYTLTFPRKLLVLDENADNTAAIEAAAEEESVDISITRTFGANFNSICLPFSLTTEELIALGVKAYEPSTVTDKGSLRFKFTTEEVASCEAGKPYLIKFSETGTWESQIFANKTIVKVPVIVDLSGLTVKGTFAPVASPKAGDKTKLVLKAGGNGFTYIKVCDETQLRAFRAWFEQN